MVTDDSITSVAALLADATRVRILCALGDGRARPAGELARLARVGASTASGHLARLVAAGMLEVESHGRHRYYRVANAGVVHALEALAGIALPAAAELPFREAHAANRLRRARTCYDHLAGLLGVQVTQAMVARGVLLPVGRGFQVTEHGERFMADFGVDVAAVRLQKRSFARACLDWSERVDHLAGALGTALLHRFFHLEWIERAAESRAVRVTNPGRRGFREAFGVETH